MFIGQHAQVTFYTNMNLNPILLIHSLKPRRKENYFILSAVLMCISRLFPNGTWGAYIFLAISVLVFLTVLVSTFKSNPFKGAAKFWYSLLVWWTILLTIEVFFTGTQGLGNTFSRYFASNNLLPNLIPLMGMCYGYAYKFDLRYLFNVLFLYCIVYIVTSFIALPEILVKGTIIQTIGLEGNGEEYSSMIAEAGTMTSFFPGFLCLFCKKYLKKKETILFVIACALQLFVMLYMARRGQTVLMLLNFFLLWYIYKGMHSRSFLVKSIRIISIVAIIYLLWSNYDGSLFSIMKERQDVDSRGSMVEDFAGTMSMKDWIIGRGWFGQYYERWLGEMRAGLEIGFLHLILKGGLLYFIPYVMTLSLCAYKGLTKSNNYLCRAFGAIVFARIISLIPFGVPYFTIQEMVVWTGVMICNSPHYLKMTDKEVFQEIR